MYALESREKTLAKAIDLRSDTVTRPSPAMLSAMARADVGDDVLRSDPTVSRLEGRVAALAGKEAALLFSSGTQSNLSALMAHCGRGDEYIAGQEAHIYRYEGGGAAVLGSIQPQPIENAEDGSLPLEKIAAAIKPIDPHFARTRLVALENTIGGKVLPQDYVHDVASFVKEAGLAFHLDGARAWNAAVASGITLEQLCTPFDSVSLCFSKGLGAPVGSVLAGSSQLIETARRWRKILGGGMRQSGYLAAACEFALEHNIERLREDHENAARLASGMKSVIGESVQYSGTNMIFIDPRGDFSAFDLAVYLNNEGIAVTPAAKLRLVTHMDVSNAAISIVIEAVKKYFSNTIPHGHGGEVIGH